MREIWREEKSTAKWSVIHEFWRDITSDDEDDRSSEFSAFNKAMVRMIYVFRIVIWRVIMNNEFEGVCDGIILM